MSIKPSDRTKRWVFRVRVSKLFLPVWEHRGLSIFIFMHMQFCICNKRRRRNVKIHSELCSQATGVNHERHSANYHGHRCSLIHLCCIPPTNVYPLLHSWLGPSESMSASDSIGLKPALQRRSTKKGRKESCFKLGS